MSDVSGAMIRPMRRDDLDDVLRWRNAPEVRRAMLTQHEIAPEEHLRWFERVSANPACRLLIFEDSGERLGFVQFRDVAPGAVALWGFHASPDAPRGTGRRMGQAALAFAFGELRLSKVCGQALNANRASIRLHEALGFGREEVPPTATNAAPDDLVGFGLLASDWRAAQEEEG